MPKLGAYAKEIVLACPDGRSREGRLLKQMREALIAHCGGEAKLTAPKRVMIERASMLQLRCAALDRKILDGTYTADEGKAYSGLSNSLVRTLAALSMRSAKPAQPADNPCYSLLANALDGFTGKIAAADVWKIVGKFRWDRRQSDNFQLGAATLFGTVYSCNAVAPIMKEQRSGKIITVSSVAGTGPSVDGGYAHYGAAKAAIAHYTRYLAQDLGPFGITANCIAPGVIATGRIMATVIPGSTQSNRDRSELVALRRLGTVEDCAKVVEFLATELSDYVTGAVIPIDGGLVRG